MSVADPSVKLPIEIPTRLMYEFLLTLSCGKEEKELVKGPLSSVRDGTLGLDQMSRDEFRIEAGAMSAARYRLVIIGNASGTDEVPSKSVNERASGLRNVTLCW